MTTNGSFDRDLERWLDAEAPVKAPIGLHAVAIDRARGARQRPRWVVALRGDTMSARREVAGRPALAMGLLVVAVGLLLVAAAFAGAFRPQPRPLGANGLIAYAVFENKQRAGQTAFSYLVRADGTANERIAVGTCPTYSADGSVMTYRSHWAGGELMVAGADGVSPRPLPIALDEGYRDDGYALSPNGTRVAWVKRTREWEVPLGDGSSLGEFANELWVTPVAGGAGARIVAASEIEGETFGSPTWSPDGTRIAFEARASNLANDPAVRRTIYVVDDAGADLRPIATRPAGAGEGLAWSPDGILLAYVGVPDGEPVPSAAPGDWIPAPSAVFVIAADGSGEQRVGGTARFASRPRWSPDGTHLGYLASDDAESYRLMVQPMNGSAPSGPPVPGPASAAFTWSPDGAVLLFIDTATETVRTIDAALDRAATIVVDLTTWPTDPLLPHSFGTDVEGCPPTWQWLQP